MGYRLSIVSKQLQAPNKNRIKFFILLISNMYNYLMALDEKERVILGLILTLLLSLSVYIHYYKFPLFPRKGKGKILQPIPVPGPSPPITRSCSAAVPASQTTTKKD